MKKTPKTTWTKFISSVSAQYEEDSPLLSLSSHLLYSPTRQLAAQSYSALS